MTGRPLGTLVRDWRVRRRRSQLDLALQVGVSPRHLSFVETGRSRASPELVEALAAELDVPLRERNVLLLAAGYAPRYAESSLADESMATIRASLQRLLDTHDPYPGVVIDRLWNVVLANDAARRLLQDLPPSLLTPTPNVFRVCLHPDGLARRTRNLGEWSAYLLGQLRRAIVLSGARELQQLADEIARYPNRAALDDEQRAPNDEPTLLVPLRLASDDGGELSLFTTLTTFGTPRDITLSELAVELFFPADRESEARLRRAREA